MAIVSLEGFESYGDLADMRRSIIPPSSTSAHSFVTGRYGGQALQTTNGVASLYFGDFTPKDTMICGHAWRQSSGLSLSLQECMAFFGLNTSSDSRRENVAIDISATGEIIAMRGTTTLGTSSAGVITHNTWHYIEAKVFVDNSVGTVDVYVDGTSVLSLTSQDTKDNNTRDANIYSIRISGASVDCEHDDIYIADTTGLTNNDILVGPLAIEALTPDADGTTNNFTPLSGLTNWEMVDDGNAPDDDTTYVSSGTVSDQDLYSFGDMTGFGETIGSVVAVQPMMHLRKEHTGPRVMRCLARNGLTTVEGGDGVCGTEWRYLKHIYETDPDGGGAWDETAVNSAEFGIKIQS